MKRVKRLVLLVLAMAMALLAFTAPVAAKATETEFTAMLETPCDAKTPEREWFSAGGRILHNRRQASKREITGDDIVGWEQIVGNVDLDLVTLDGNAWGEVTLHMTWAGVTGTFEAHYSGKITDGYIDGTVVGHGSGGLEGMKFMAHFYDVDPPPDPHLEALEGIILDPHGG